MAGPFSIFFNPDADEGSKLAPEVVAEIQAVAPSTVLALSITTAKLAELAVTGDKIALGAVDSDQIATKGVLTVNIGDEAVDTAQIADDAVTPAKAGTGIVVAVDNTGTTIALTTKFVTAAQMAAISSPDVNTLYFVSA